MKIFSVCETMTGTMTRARERTKAFKIDILSFASKIP
jgi:hypothetical protein